MKLKVIEYYNDSQLGKLMKPDDIVEVKTKKRAAELEAAKVAVIIEETDEVEETAEEKEGESNAEA